MDYDDHYTDAVTPNGVLIGTPHCPLCCCLLSLNSMPDVGETHWHCSNCGWWDTKELVEILMRDEG